MPLYFALITIKVIPGKMVCLGAAIELALELANFTCPEMSNLLIDVGG